MAITSRQTVRERLATLYTAEAVFSQVYGYAPVDLQGMTPVLVIYATKTRHVDATADLKYAFYTFILDVYIKRASGETVEDTLDTLHETIRSVVSDNVADGNWDNIELEDESDAYFAEISGVAYRVESHPVTVKVLGT